MKKLFFLLAIPLVGKSDYIQQKNAPVILVDSISNEPIQKDSILLAQHPAVLSGHFEVVKSLPTQFSRVVFVRPEE